MTTERNNAGDRPLTADDILAAAGITSPPAIDITCAPYAIINLINAINDGAIPDVYVRNGALVHLTRITGDTTGTTPLAALDITPDTLALLLARHTRTYKKRGDHEVPATPSTTVLRAVLAATEWPGARPLRGVVTAPVIRPDGRILQEPGYDPDTWLYYAPTLPIPPVPDFPDTVDVANAKNVIFGQVLADFPWADDASRANFLALLATPLLRPYINSLAPLGAISATAPGSGKTLLTDIIGSLYGLSSRPWVNSDEELRKAVTALLRTSNSPVVVFDNVDEFDQVDQPSLAKLLTSEVWHDRELGTSNQVGLPNDRLWLVTGNNIRLGGDIPSRTILVRLDPRMPHPDRRTNFRIPDLGRWLKNPENRGELLYHLLILARAWIAAGAPTIATPMRNFRDWASVMAGFTTYHGVPGFMDNRAELDVHDEQTVTWRAFLATWYRRHGARPLTAAELLADARVSWDGDDPWHGTFLTNKHGDRPTVRGLGMMLSGKRGRFFGEYSLHRTVDGDTNTGLYYVTYHSPDELAQLQQEQGATQ